MAPSARPAPARQQTLRQHNLALVARTVVGAESPLSRADVAARTGLTRATVSALVDRLIGAGLVRELAPATPQGAGRPGVPLAPAPRTLVGVGLEVNLGYLGARVLDLTGATVAELIEPGDFHHSRATEVLGRLGGLARTVLDDVAAAGMRPAGIRLALPGLVDARSGRLRIAPNLGWSSLDPTGLLGLPAGIPFAVANEANLAAVAQVGRARLAPRARPTSYLYVSGDVGIGGAIVVDGEVFGGRHGWAGEIGHVVLDAAGPRCRCGARGCLEQYAGKDALWQRAGLPAQATVAQLVAELAGAAPDPAAVAAVQGAGTALGHALADTINLVDLDTVLLGGMYPDLLPFFTDALSAVLAARVVAAPWAEIAVRPAPVGDRPALTGGAREVLRDVVRRPAGVLSMGDDAASVVP